MRDIEAFFASTQEGVSGTVTVLCSHGSFSVQGITSDNDLMRSSFATYGEENKAWDGADARGFATINAISTSLWRSVHHGGTS
jgi:argininosuccinate synthase